MARYLIKRGNIKTLAGFATVGAVVELNDADALAFADTIEPEGLAAKRIEAAAKDSAAELEKLKKAEAAAAAAAVKAGAK